MPLGLVVPANAAKRLVRLAISAGIAERGIIGAAVRGERSVKAVFAALALVLLTAGCGDDKPSTPASGVSSEEILKRNCADPAWREQNLGLWYSVCRQPLRW